MKIYFNSLGVVTNFETEQADSLRQGSVGNKITAIFDGIIVSDCVPTLNFTRSDGSIISNVGMDIVDTNKCELVFDDPWYFALAGNATMTIFLHDGSGNVVAQGQHLIAIESSDYDPSAVPPIDQEEYNYLLAQLANKINKSGVSQLGESMSWSDGESEIFSYENGAFTFNLPVSLASLDAQAITINDQAVATEAYVQSELIPYATEAYVQEQISAIVLDPFETKVDATAKYNELNGKINNVREVAEGKCKTIVISYLTQAPTNDLLAQGLKKPDGTHFADLQDFEHYVEYADVDYDDVLAGECINNLFNSQENYEYVDMGNYYIITFDNVVYKYTYQSKEGAQEQFGLKTGDIILVLETNVPDRWYDYSDDLCNILETTKVDLTPFVNHVEDSSIHVTPQDKTNWNGKSVVSGSGIGTSTTPITYITIDGVEYVITPQAAAAIPWGNVTGNLADQTDLKNALDAKVDKTSSANQVYVTDANGDQTSIGYSEQDNGSTLVKRQSNAQIQVPATPVANTDAASKSYVDERVRKVYISVLLTPTKIKDDITNNSFTVKNSSGIDITSAVSNGDYDSDIINEDFDSGTKKISYGIPKLIAIQTNTTEYTLYFINGYFKNGDFIIVTGKYTDTSGYIPLIDYGVINTRVYHVGERRYAYDDTLIGTLYSFVLNGTTVYKNTVIFKEYEAGSNEQIYRALHVSRITTSDTSTWANQFGGSPKLSSGFKFDKFEYYNESHSPMDHIYYYFGSWLDRNYGTAWYVRNANPGTSSDWDTFTFTSSRTLTEVFEEI